MSALAAEIAWTGTAFRTFADERPEHERWELIDGRPVMQASASLRHQIIAGNAVRLMNAALERGGSGLIAIESFMVDIAEASPGQMYVPDVLVVEPDEAEGQENATSVPLAVVEIVSPSDRRRLPRSDLRRVEVKLHHYRALTSCRTILLIEQDRVEIVAHLRSADGWTEQRFNDPDEPLSIPALGLACTVGDFYARTPLGQRR
ncbi:MAG: Uma2 family endonuclease [Methylobacteriaceae bacterium]|nr:Uma2 family endonuclease [Methylobacteriaceae bacterium]